MKRCQGERSAGTIGLVDLSFFCPYPEVHRELHKCRGIWEGRGCALWLSSTSSSDLCPSLFPLQVSGRGWDSKVLESCRVYLNLSPYSKATFGFYPHYPTAGKACVTEIQHTALVCLWEHGGRL